MHQRVLSIVALTFFSLSSQAQPRLPMGYEAHRDLEYAKIKDTSLQLDIYAPMKSDKPLPLVVWVHGGGWRAGDKKQCPALFLLEKGYVVASVNYRLTDQAIFPAQIEDCKAALRWLRAHAEKYHIDPKHVGVWGSSAGGHLVALLGTSGEVKELEGKLGNPKESSRAQAVCDYFGPTDLLQMDAHALPGSRLKHDAPNSPESKLIGGPIQENKDKARRADPITYVSKDDPPFLIVHGDKDPLVPMHQSEILHAALEKAGVESTFIKLEGAGHGGREFQTPEMRATVTKFFDKHLKSAQ